MFVLLIKNLLKYFKFEVTVIDDKHNERVFISSNFQTLTRVKGNICSLPMKLEDGWNQIHINFEEFVKKAFGNELCGDKESENKRELQNKTNLLH